MNIIYMHLKNGKILGIQNDFHENIYDLVLKLKNHLDKKETIYLNDINGTVTIINLYEVNYITVKKVEA